MEIIKLNLIPSGVNPTCHCSQYDEGRVIRIELFDGLTPYVLKSGDAVTLNVRKPDNTIVTASVTATQGNKYVDIVTTEQICACVGYNLCDLTITNGSVVIGTLNFIMQVERDVLADGIPSQSVIEDLDALVQEAVGDNYYTKTEVDAALALKADSSDVEAALALKANSSDVYTKTEVNNLLDLKADKSELLDLLPTDTVSGDIANLPDGANNAPVKSFKAMIVPLQAGSGDPSPSNVRNISGFTQAKIYRSGVNLWDEVFESGSINTTTGQNETYGTDRMRSKNYIPVRPNTTYYFASTNNKYVYIYCYGLDNSYIGIYGGGASLRNATFTTPSGCYFIRFRTDNYGTSYNNDMSINYPSTDTTYHAHVSGMVTYIVSWQSSEGTVYGGYLSYENGSWTITLTHKMVDLGSLNWLRYSPDGTNIPVYYAGITGLKPNTSNGLCEIFKVIPWQALTNRTDKTLCVHPSIASVYIADTDYTTAESFKAAVDGYKYICALAEPVTYGLSDNTVIETMLGDNNFYADCGSVDLTYRADIKLYVDKRVSQIPAALSLSRVAAPSGEAESEER